MQRQPRRKMHSDIVAPRIRNISASDNVDSFSFGTYSMLEFTGLGASELFKPLPVIGI